MQNKNDIALVIQGGSLRSIFSVGILDAFTAEGFNPFNYYVGVSGGAMSLSYYLSEQYGVQYKLMRVLMKDKNFINFRKAFTKQGIVNLEYLEEFSQKHYPLDIRQVIRNLQQKMVEVVATNMKDGSAVYLQPTMQNWFHHLRASASLPFLSRGVHEVDGLKLMDGGWSDAIPVRRAIRQGAKKIIVIRTLPTTHREDWTYLGLFGGFWHRNNPKLQRRFTDDHVFYNESADFLDKVHPELEIFQLAPEKYLRTCSYSATQTDLDFDYRCGLNLGKDFIYKHAYLFE